MLMRRTCAGRKPASWLNGLRSERVVQIPGTYPRLTPLVCPPFVLSGGVRGEAVRFRWLRRGRPHVRPLLLRPGHRDMGGAAHRSRHPGKTACLDGGFYVYCSVGRATLRGSLVAVLTLLTSPPADSPFPPEEAQVL